jgi:hypothetical protein
MYGNFGREITKYTVIYGAYIRFWPTLDMNGKRGWWTFANGVTTVDLGCTASCFGARFA